MEIQKMLLTPNTWSRPQKQITVKKVVVHYTGNPKSTAKNNRDYFNNAPYHKRYISAHYVVGLKGEIIQCVPENEIAYCSNQANAYSISIETCHPDKTGKFNAVTEQALIELVADICKRYKLNPQTDVIRHYDVNGKHCPLYYVNNPSAWTSFKNRVELALKPQQEKRWKVEIYPIRDLKDAQRIKSLFDNARAVPLYSEIKKRDDGFYKVSSFKYINKKDADEVCEGIKKLTQSACYVWEYK